MNVIHVQLTVLLLFVKLELSVGRDAREVSGSQRLLAAQLASSRASPKLLTPQANDTITQSYYEMVDDAIKEAESRLQGNAPSQVIPQQPWEQVYSNTRTKTVWTADAMTPGEMAASKAFKPEDHIEPNKVAGWSMVPYDMQLGARLMYGMSEHGTTTPPPAQPIVDETLVALCPMIMFSDAVDISAPKCDQTFGDWIEPSSQRRILRWQPNTGGGMRFGVDSAINGNGSVTYAEIDEQLTWKGTSFNLYNCLKMMRWTIDEEITRVASMGRGTQSTMQEHDKAFNGQAYFYKYTIRAANGSAVAATNLFRAGAAYVNVTLSGSEEQGEGALVAMAHKKGNWKADAWGKCSATASNRVWSVGFPLETSSVNSVATVQDIRIASAALITLMAFREQHVSQDTGLVYEGRVNVVVEMMQSAMLVFVAVVACISVCVFVKRMRWDVRMRRLLFKVEAVLLPKWPSWQREPAFFPTY
eukprot:TRINITY_DN92021_c0_g1_i1.p1 TRINITY_DN92021_c0_g1~~TRINITY_DN92021_c0_g1_i1.p1  ORF type:complete len:473 (-),score=116.91 TRINITY_DN92021_c0_g1_i1:41-1459(-)